MLQEAGIERAGFSPTHADLERRGGMVRFQYQQREDLGFVFQKWEIRVRVLIEAMRFFSEVFSFSPYPLSSEEKRRSIQEIAFLCFFFNPNWDRKLNPF